MDISEKTYNNKRKNKNLAREVRDAYLAVKPDGSTSDVLGSYTGNPLDDDKPVQDADDL